VRRFVPALGWLTLVLCLGSAAFGAQQTQRWVVPVLRALAPSATNADLRAAHAVTRKLAHVTEYSVLALLWLRAVRAGGRGSLRTASWIALLVCVTCAFVDEGHQATLLTRTGSAADAVLDSVAALTALMIVRTRNAEGARLPAATAGEVA
jgi:VanZ family protein